MRFNQIQAYSTLLSGISEVGHDEVDLVLDGRGLGRELDVGQRLQDVADAALLAELLGHGLLLGLRHLLGRLEGLADHRKERADGVRGELRDLVFVVVVVRACEGRERGSQESVWSGLQLSPRRTRWRLAILGSLGSRARCRRGPRPQTCRRLPLRDLVEAKDVEARRRVLAEIGVDFGHRALTARAADVVHLVQAGRVGRPQITPAVLTRILYILLSIFVGILSILVVNTF